MLDFSMSGLVALRLSESSSDFQTYEKLLKIILSALGTHNMDHHYESQQSLGPIRADNRGYYGPMRARKGTQGHSGTVPSKL